MQMNIAVCDIGGSLYHFSLFFKSVCFIPKTSLLAIIAKFGGGDDSILLLTTKTPL
jgi:hypothetical protein